MMTLHPTISRIMSDTVVSDGGLALPEMRFAFWMGVVCQAPEAATIGVGLVLVARRMKRAGMQQGAEQLVKLAASALGFDQAASRLYSSLSA